MERIIRLGKLNKTFGLKGHLRCFIEPSILYRLKQPEVVFIAVKDNQLPYFPDEFDVNESGHGMIHFEEVNDKTAADLLAGKDLFVETKYLKKTMKAPQSPADCIGFRIVDEQAGVHSTLTDYYELPEHALGAFVLNGKEVLFPWHDEVVQHIDRKKKEIRLRLPEGLLNIYTA